MRKLLIRWLIRRAWKLAVRQDNRYGKLNQRYNMLALLTTAAGGHSGWFPKDVTTDFLERLRECRNV